MDDLNIQIRCTLRELEALETNPAWKQIAEQLRRERQETADAIARGHELDLGTIRIFQGQVDALDRVLNVFDDIRDALVAEAEQKEQENDGEEPNDDE